MIVSGTWSKSQEACNSSEDCGVILGLENLAGTNPSNFCAAAREHMLTIKKWILLS